MTIRDQFETRRLELFEAAGAPVEPRHLTDHEGRPVHALARGGGEPAVFVHGGLSHAGEWAPVIARLPQSRGVLLVDRPGCGLSYAIDYRGVDYREHAAKFVEAVLDDLGIEQADLVGNSMGGFFCLAFALQHPERVRSLALIGAPAGLVKYIPWPLRLMSLPWLGEMLLSGDATPDQMRSRLYDPQLVRDARRVSDESIELGGLNMKLRDVRNAARTMLGNVVGLTGWRRLIRDEVAELDVRTRFIWGSHDAFEAPDSGRKLAERMPSAEFVVVEDAGHLPWHDHPEECAAALESFWMVAGAQPTTSAA